MSRQEKQMLHYFQVIQRVDQTKKFENKEECIKKLLERIEGKKTLLSKDTMIVKKAIKELLEENIKLKEENKK